MAFCNRCGSRTPPPTCTVCGSTDLDTAESSPAPPVREPVSSTPSAPRAATSPPPSPAPLDQPGAPASSRRGRQVAAAVIGVGILLAAALVFKGTGSRTDARSITYPATQAQPAGGPVADQSPTSPSSAAGSTASTTSTTATPSSTSTTPDFSSPEAARAELDSLYAADRPHLVTDGHWVIQLSSQWNGITDARTSRTYYTTDILKLAQNLEATYGSNLVLVQSTDLGLQRSYPNKPPDEPLWVMLYDQRTLTSSSADAWCAAQFPTLSGDDLRNVCYPRKADPPHS